MVQSAVDMWIEDRLAKEARHYRAVMGLPGLGRALGICM